MNGVCSCYKHTGEAGYEYQRDPDCPIHGNETPLAHPDVDDQTQNALKACPFCGGNEVALGTLPQTNGNTKFIYCLSCHARGPWFFVNNPTSNNWNRRFALSDRVEHVLRDALPLLELVRDYEPGEPNGNCAPNRARVICEQIEAILRGPVNHLAEREIYEAHLKTQLANEYRTNIAGEGGGLPTGPCQCETCVKVRSSPDHLADQVTALEKAFAWLRDTGAFFERCNRTARWQVIDRAGTVLAANDSALNAVLEAIASYPSTAAGENKTSGEPGAANTR